MIDSRQDNSIRVYIDKDILLSKVSPYQIFKHFCPPFKEPGKKFKSDLRKDSNPTVSIALIRDTLIYKDFGNDEHVFNCISYVQHKYSTDYYGALMLIDRTFGIGLAEGKISDMPSIKLIKEPKIIAKQPAKIKVKTRPWDYRDRQYWGEFGITKQILRKFGVLPINYYWINEKRFSCDSISYRYRFDCGYKIYRPLEDDFKWSSNVGSHCLQGYHELPKTGDEIFLTSSLKDIMCLASLGYASFALQSEMLVPSEKTIKEIQTRFKKITVFYDNDYSNPNNPGQAMAKKICRKFNIKNIYIPSSYKSKDISDLVKNYSLKEAKNVIKNMERTSQERLKDKVEANGSGRDQIPF
tara:strand:+ start:691 stop:1752 length:1062 start_codon:yes stop_codon:yes gene_type:complete